MMTIMSLSASLLPEFDLESANTRKVLERVPEDRPDYKPHPKSMSLARLAGHLAELPVWAGRALGSDTFDVQPGTPAATPYLMTSRAEFLEHFDRNVAAARAAIEAATDEDLAGPWTLLAGGRKVFTLPKSAVLRSFVLSHSIHHRAQLGVYLRLNDVPVPSIYGPTADENPFGG
jgi:uncharacterized damage-inducible protein DinB